MKTTRRTLACLGLFLAGCASAPARQADSRGPSSVSLSGATINCYLPDAPEGSATVTIKGQEPQGEYRVDLLPPGLTEKYPAQCRLSTNATRQRCLVDVQIDGLLRSYQVEIGEANWDSGSATVLVVLLSDTEPEKFPEKLKLACRH